MNTDTAPDVEIRPYSPVEVGHLVSLFRASWGWSQETLAELSRLTVRTIQRVEAGEPSSLDTRRALARAFQMEDIDSLNKAHEFATPEGAARAKAEFDRKFLTVDISPTDGRALLKALAASGPYRAYQSGSVGCVPKEAENLYAQIIDFLSDVLDVMDMTSHVELLRYGDHIEDWIAGMRAYGFEIGLGVRKVSFGIGSGRPPGELSYVMAVPMGGGLRQVAVEREIEPRSV